MNKYLFSVTRLDGPNYKVFVGNRVSEIHTIMSNHGDCTKGGHMEMHAGG